MGNIKHLTTTLTPAGLIDQIDFFELKSIALVTQDKSGVIRAYWSNQDSAELALSSAYLHAKLTQHLSSLPEAPPQEKK